MQAESSLTAPYAFPPSAFVESLYKEGETHFSMAKLAQALEITASSLTLVSMGGEAARYDT